jgi:phosphoribosylformylglycinamidine cyclo-ligase
MYRTFNCGVGMICVVSRNDAEKAVEILNSCGEKSWIIGSIESAEKGEEQVVIK